jgi:hypothetical protein
MIENRIPYRKVPWALAHEFAYKMARKVKKSKKLKKSKGGHSSIFSKKNKRKKIK